ncbi:MAG: hypothetical protein JSS07_09775 [Proteobacteria bacterium]|nr:hypothetical protein [Pseudomonadota bacterium]
MTNHNQKSVAKKRKAKSVGYQKYLIDSLKNPVEAKGYLNAAIEGGDINVILLAIQNAIDAQRI